MAPPPSPRVCLTADALHARAMTTLAWSVLMAIACAVLAFFALHVAFVFAGFLRDARSMHADHTLRSFADQCTNLTTRMATRRLAPPGAGACDVNDENLATAPWVHALSQTWMYIFEGAMPRVSAALSVTLTTVLGAAIIALMISARQFCKRSQSQRSLAAAIRHMVAGEQG